MKKYMSIDDLVKDDKYPFTKAQLRHFVAKRKQNGLITSIRKIGRRIYIREDLFDKWIDSHLENEIKGESEEINTSEERQMSFEYLKIEDMEFSVRTLNCLKSLNIKSAEDLAKLSKSELKQTRNMGKKSFEEIQDKLTSIGIILRD